MVRQANIPDPLSGKKNDDNNSPYLMGLKVFEKLLSPLAGTQEALCKSWLNKTRKVSLYDSFEEVKMHGREDFLSYLYFNP